MKNLILIWIMSLAMNSIGQTTIKFAEPVHASDSLIIDLVKQIDSAWNSRNIDWFAGLFTEDCDIHYITKGWSTRTREGVRGMYGEGFKKRSSDIRHYTHPKEIIWLEKDLCMGTGYTDIVSDPGDGSKPGLLMRHNGFMLFRITDEGPKVQMIRAWTEEPVSSQQPAVDSQQNSR